MWRRGGRGDEKMIGRMRIRMMCFIGCGRGVMRRNRTGGRRDGGGGMGIDEGMGGSRRSGRGRVGGEVIGRR